MAVVITAMSGYGYKWGLDMTLWAIVFAQLSSTKVDILISPIAGLL